MAGDTQEYWLHALVATATADSGEQVQILPDPLRDANASAKVETDRGCGEIPQAGHT